jgi:ribose transport system permease protein
VSNAKPDRARSEQLPDNDPTARADHHEPYEGQHLRTPGRLRRLATHRDFAILLVALALFAFFALFTPSFLTEQTMLEITWGVSILGILAVGMTFLFVSGELDLSIGSNYGFLLILISYQNERLGVDPSLASLIVIVIGMMIGAVNGFLITRIGLSSFITTLGMMVLLRGGANAISSGYPIPVEHTDLPFYRIIRAGFLGTPVPNMFVAMLVVAGIGAVLLARTKFGSDVYATGGNVDAAQNSGINTRRVKFRCFVAMGGLCGIAAALLFGRIGLAPLDAGSDVLLKVIAAVIVGGVGLFGGHGTIFGAVIGVLIAGMITSGLILMGVNGYWDGVVTGAIILIAVGLNLAIRRHATGRIAEA